VTVLLSLLLDNWQAVAGAFGVIGLLLFGRSSANKTHKIKKAKAHEKTHDRINQITPVDPDDRDDIERRLREHSE
jgi:hypothetical protein|tara:strand:+ start:339 stop:563 length:225 start_codon:yes stop_codon:yes gene_type:complete